MMMRLRKIPLSHTMFNLTVLESQVWELRRQGGRLGFTAQRNIRSTEYSRQSIDDDKNNDPVRATFCSRCKAIINPSCWTDVKATITASCAYAGSIVHNFKTMVSRRRVSLVVLLRFISLGHYVNISAAPSGLLLTRLTRCGSTDQIVDAARIAHTSTGSAGGCARRCAGALVGN